MRHGGRPDICHQRESDNNGDSAGAESVRVSQPEYWASPDQDWEASNIGNWVYDDIAYDDQVEALKKLPRAFSELSAKCDLIMSVRVSVNDHYSYR